MKEPENPKKIQTREIHSRKEWDEIVMKFTDQNILQSWAWGEFNQTLGHKIIRIAYYEAAKVIGAASIQIEKTRYGKWMYIPYGPLTNWRENTYRQILRNLKNLAKQEKCIYLSIDPQLDDNKKNQGKFIKNGFTQALRHIQANHKWLLDITKEKDELLANMRKNTRYSIRKATKEGVSVKSSKDPSDLKRFISILSQTSYRKKFFIKSEEHYKQQFETLTKSNNMMIFWAEHNGKPVSASLISFFGSHSAYLWSATVSDLSNQVPAAYPVIWQAILEAKNRGCTVFDFWGIAPPNSKDHPWAGFSFFKTGFGGTYRKLILPFDYPASPLYWIVRAIAGSRKIWGKLYKEIRLR